MHLSKLIITGVSNLFCTSLTAQDTAMKVLKLDEMSAFKSQAGNWQIVGELLMNPTMDSHQEAPTPIDSGKKNKDKKAV